MTHIVWYVADLHGGVRLLEPDAQGVLHDVTLHVLIALDRTAVGGERPMDKVGDYATPSLAQLVAWCNRTHQNYLFREPSLKHTRATL